MHLKHEKQSRVRVTQAGARQPEKRSKKQIKSENTKKGRKATAKKTENTKKGGGQDGKGVEGSGGGQMCLLPDIWDFW